MYVETLKQVCMYAYVFNTDCSTLFQRFLHPKRAFPRKFAVQAIIVMPIIVMPIILSSRISVRANERRVVCMVHL